MAKKDNGLIAANKSSDITDRSPLWDEVEKKHLKKQPYCVACGKDVKYIKGLQVHHIIPFHIVIELGRHDLELDERNLMTLCENEDGIKTQNHHLLIGHLDDWQSFNYVAKQDSISTFHSMPGSQIKADPNWKKETTAKPKHIDKMSVKEKDELRKYINKRFPKK